MYVIPAILVLALPRLSILGLWFFTDWFNGVFDGFLWPVLGFFIVPLTTIWYSVVVNIFHGEWGWLQIGVLVPAILIDLSPAKHGRKKK